jgi:tetratricopeptide (TPR) repeat protein
MCLLGRTKNRELQGGSAMTATLNLFDHLLARGRGLRQSGRYRDEARLLSRLAGFRDLPGEVAEEAQARLAELHLRRRRYAQARRHLAAALGHRPDSARYHYLMAVAVRADDQGELERAAEHYRRSLELNPNQVRCRCDYGLLLLRLGRTDEGLAHLREAVALAPEEAEPLGKLVQGLCLAGRADEARSELLAARFRQPRSPGVLKLWHDFQLQELRRRREAERLGLGEGEEDGPVLLPFMAPANEGPAGAREPTILRRDGAEPLGPPHLRLPARRSSRRRVR